MKSNLNNYNEVFTGANYAEGRLAMLGLYRRCGILNDPGPSYAIGFGEAWSEISEHPTLKHDPVAAALASVLTLAATLQERDLLLVAALLGTPRSATCLVHIAECNFADRWHQEVYPSLRALLRVAQPDDDQICAIVEEFAGDVIANDQWKLFAKDNEVAAAT